MRAKDCNPQRQSEIREERELYVAKRNALIQKSRYSLSTQQQKVLLYLISKIKPEDDLRKTMYEVSIREFCGVCNIAMGSGKNYDDVKTAIKGLADKSVWVKGKDGKEILCRWLNEVEIDGARSIVYFSFHKSMDDYLMGLTRQYTQYKLINVLCMKSKYSIRLYELLKSYDGINRVGNESEITMPLDALKRCLDAENYTNLKDFKRRVFSPAVKEVNEYSRDFRVEFEFINIKSRSANAVVFTITSFSEYSADGSKAAIKQYNALWDADIYKTIEGGI